MRRRFSFVPPLALVAMGLAWHGQAHAFCRTTTAAAASQVCTEEGAPLFWRNECRGVRMNSDNLEGDQATVYENTLKVALAQWDRADCPGGGNASLTLDYLGANEKPFGYDDLPDAKNENGVFYRKADWQYPNGNEVALTTVTFRSDTGDILDADIEVNANLNISTERPLPQRGFDLQTVFAHELGHVLGLAHSDDRAATMFATYNPGTIDQGELEDDDRAGLCAIYLPNGARAAAGGDTPADTCDPEAAPLQDPPDEGCGCRIPGVRRGPAELGSLSLAGLFVLACVRRRRSAVGRQRN